MSQKVAYVTGGMGGIGTAICQRLHKEGFTVIAGCGPTRDFTKWLDDEGFPPEVKEKMIAAVPNRMPPPPPPAAPVAPVAPVGPVGPAIP